MPISHRILPEHRLAVFTHVGPTDDEEFLRVYRDHFFGEASDRPMNRLIDLRRAESQNRSTGALRIIADMLNKALAGTNSKPMVAVVAPGRLSYGLARMFGGISGEAPVEVMVFDSVEPALRWLGAPGEVLDE